mmetsp:Transcript_677/g.868  ORF Transcript_677/g.868 Transcript_677/m.868 type:complete len:130 (+) Transcript_677:37-426(+)
MNNKNPQKRKRGKSLKENYTIKIHSNDGADFFTKNARKQEKMEHKSDIMMLKQRVRSEIIRLCTLRGAEKTICPSEVARSLDKANWRNLMEEVRKAGQELAEEEIIVFTQKGVVINPSNFKGPIRFRLV